MEVIASIGLFNTASFNVYEILDGIEQYIVGGINDSVPMEYLVRYDESGEAYILHGEIELYLNEMILL